MEEEIKMGEYMADEGVRYNSRERGRVEEEVNTRVSEGRSNTADLYVGGKVIGISGNDRKRDTKAYILKHFSRLTHTRLINFS